mmetsp:Transcript_73940/g.197050  ORF Transcript_73940/g.197050 Transcript_73940/m.197050 type:complete len:288 (-) Transcript_73940:1295-2158(-)
MVMGSCEPFIVTQSILRCRACTSGLSMLKTLSDSRMSTLNWCVPDSSLAARFTLGERYEASILSIDPMAPSMPHPTCRPKPSVTRYPGIASWILGLSVILRSTSLAWTSMLARMKDLTASSAMSPTGLLMSASSSRRHTSRNESPMFLLGAPWLSWQARCTMSAMVLTKSIVSSWRHSVHALKLRTMAKPKMACILRPATKVEVVMPSVAMLLSLLSTSAPASPKAIWISLPNLRSARSTNPVSNSSMPVLCDSSMGASGFLLSRSTSLAILPMGPMTSRSASRWKK